MDEKEYIVTVKEGIDWREVHEDLTKENQKQFIPNHKVPVDDLREINKRNTHYHLSDQEAAELRKDCLLYTSPSPRDMTGSRMPSSA